jgi:hypothetical protein
VLDGPSERERENEDLNRHDDGHALAKQAFALADASAWQEAADTYASALLLLDPDDYWTSIILGEYASVLTALKRHAEARQVRERELALVLKEDPSGYSPAILMARYYLGEECLLCNDPVAALASVVPSLGAPGRFEGLLRLVQADALWRLGRRDEAEQAAALAESACSEAQRDRIRERLHQVRER